MALLEGVVTTVIDLQFIAMLKGRYHGDTLAIAVALFYGGTNAILFLLQVAAVPRLLVTRSLPTTAAIHPMLALAWYAVFAVAPGLRRDRGHAHRGSGAAARDLAHLAGDRAVRVPARATRALEGAAARRRVAGRRRARRARAAA